MRPAVYVALDTDAGDAPRPGWLRGKLRRVVGLLGLAGAKLTVVVIDDAAMGAMHQRYSGVAGTTDVLTFDYAERPARAGYPRLKGAVVEGEVYVCIDEARRRAGELGHGVDAELLLYAVHGLLHLLGYDDHRPVDHRRMHAKEDRILSELGVGPVFAKAKAGGETGWVKKRRGDRRN